MARHRSPNYPAHGLSEALDFAKAIYAKEKRSQAPGEIVAKALGYSSLSGNARVKIATLKKYGLLEGDESKGMRLSDLAMRLLYPDGGSEEAEARRIAALTPSLFRSIYEEKSGASDDALTNFLISRMDFSPVGARQAIEAFRDTISFAGLSGESYNASRTQDVLEAQDVRLESREAPQLSLGQQVARAPRSWSWPLSMPRGVNAQLTLTGQFTKADIGRLKRQIEFLEESFDEEEAQ